MYTTLRKISVFEGYSWFVLLYSIAMPVVPWVFERRQGWRRVWKSAGIALLGLAVFQALLWPACTAMGCGDRAMLVVMMWWFVAPISVVVTAISAAAASPPL